MEDSEVSVRFLSPVPHDSTRWAGCMRTTSQRRNLETVSLSTASPVTGRGRGVGTTSFKFWFKSYCRAHTLPPAGGEAPSCPHPWPCAPTLVLVRFFQAVFRSHPGFHALSTTHTQLHLKDYLFFSLTNFVLIPLPQGHDPSSEHQRFSHHFCSSFCPASLPYVRLFSNPFSALWLWSSL